ncbi:MULTISPECIES: class I SAM-dependent DNA methyltransferase [Gordonia]|uniref:class I SAM-dependent DNA methyltransferase n=1 Tax=Gordonia TaxID=2053 RepID=UPI00071C3BC5|nr:MULTISPECIES: SAM-dependent methyltransferase [unclassified Gordonia (in: high G+C Gram-positive bacteria)]KSU59138.1 SAM-dependent methyltransferase [Gordonia sp. SGD-V-85]SCC07048.1 Nodulation protein S (NodS) [Gordonia sp. v-85]
MADDHTAGSREGLADNYFHDMYRDSDDPWGFTSRWYEQRKYALSLAALSSPRYGSVFEPGCSVGVLSAQLATRADHLLCTDVSPRAVELARERLDGHDSVEVRVGDIVSDWPPGRFDLIVLSEVLYYLGDADLDELITRLPECLTPTGEVLAVHWRWRVEEYPRTGDEVHAALRSSALHPSASYSDTDFCVDVMTSSPIGSVAQREGLVTVADAHRTA